MKTGHDRDFRTAWRQIAAAHTKAQMDERKALAEIDKVGGMHTADPALR